MYPKNAPFRKNFIDKKGSVLEELGGLAQEELEEAEKKQTTDIALEDAQCMPTHKAGHREAQGDDYSCPTGSE